MTRLRLLAATLAVAGLAVLPRAARAQQSAEPADSTVRARELVPIVITAEEKKKQSWLQRLGLRSRYSQIERENKEMERTLAFYDRKIARLEAHLDSLKTVVRDSMMKDLARIDSTTHEIRARRLALEARIKELEKGTP
jgi:hypothetical protein